MHSAIKIGSPARQSGFPIPLLSKEICAVYPPLARPLQGIVETTHPMNPLPLSLLLAAIVAAFALSSCVSVKSEEPVTHTTTTVDTPVSPGASVTRTTTTY